MSDTLTRKDYYRNVGLCADAVIEAVKDGQDVEDAIHEVADGDEWVIYTYRAHMVWAFSDNESAICEAVDGDWADGLTDPSSLFPRIAYYALAQDIRDELERRGFDPDAEEDEPHTDGRTDSYGSLNQ